MDEWWRGSVTYQIYPRSFQDTTGNGIGDLRGVIERLPYVASLGVDALWLSPFFKSPMADMGYDVADYTDVDPLFGDLTIFDELVARAHELNLKVIIDQVLSHSSNQHPFFLESRASRHNTKSDWYVWADPRYDGGPPNNWLAVFGGGAWSWEPRRRQYYLHNFSPEQPDWNFHNRDVQDWLLGTVRFWLERGVDGLRLDVVNFYFHDKLLRDNPADFRPKTMPDWNPFEMQYHLFSKNQPENLGFLERLRDLLDEYDARTTVGEVYDLHHPLNVMGEYTTGRRRLHQCYSFDMLSDTFCASHFRELIERFFDIAPEGWPCWAFSNHDVKRHVSRWMPHAAEDTALAKQCCALLLCFQGSICIFQGEELGQLETDLEFDELTDLQGKAFWPETQGRDGCRTPMVWDASKPHAGFTTGQPWLPVKRAQLQRDASRQIGNDQSVLEFYRAMLALRKDEQDLRLGNTVFLDTPEPILAFVRGDRTGCVFNLSSSEQTIAAKGITEFLLTQEVDDRTQGFIHLGPSAFAIFGCAPTLQISASRQQS